MSSPAVRSLSALVICACLACSRDSSAPSPWPSPRGEEIRTPAEVAPHVFAAQQKKSALLDAAPALSPSRQLRRITLALTGQEPTLSQYQALLAAPDDAGRKAILDKAIDDGLSSQKFYDEMLAFGHDWLRTSDFVFGNVNPAAWKGGQAIAIELCPSGSLHAGAYRYSDEAWDGICDDSSARVDQVSDPWWAPGTTVTTLGNIGSGVRSSGGVDCGIADNQRRFWGTFLEGGSGCSCGPHLVYCAPMTFYQYSGSNYFPTDRNPRMQGQRRAFFEEPARLFAHIVTNDRPFTDLILGDYTVATLGLEHAYVRAARQDPSTAAVLDDKPWWQGVTDPNAWREVKISEMDPLLLADRSYTFDPRTDLGQAKGIPSAGVLTMIGSLAAFPRERVRAARWLEILACVQFNAPDPSQVFNEFKNDPASQGSCQHCHGAGGIDATAIHFKRVMNRDSGDIVYGGVGPWTWSALKKNGGNQRDSEPLERWTSAFIPDTALTPATAADLTAHPEARLIDFLPPGQTLFGQPSDGTIGPLGFAKMLVASGAFDRCAARKIYARVFGRDIDLTKEGPYLDQLTADFVANGRKVRPFIRELMSTDEFRRGL